MGSKDASSSSEEVFLLRSVCFCNGLEVVSKCESILGRTERTVNVLASCIPLDARKYRSQMDACAPDSAIREVPLDIAVFSFFEREWLVSDCNGGSVACDYVGIGEGNHLLCEHAYETVSDGWMCAVLGFSVAGSRRSRRRGGGVWRKGGGMVGFGKGEKAQGVLLGPRHAAYRVWGDHNSQKAFLLCACKGEE